MKLTRKLVLSKAKASDLDSVKKLNCWGCNLTDVSVSLFQGDCCNFQVLDVVVLTSVRFCLYSLSLQISIFSQIPNIEVLTLSVNSIVSLSPLAGCLSLCELYLRRNLIPSLSELSHLRPLTRLRVLWLAENPCCATEPSQYRLTVLRCLPRLQKLDNQVVTEEEVALALEEGDEITAPPAAVQNQLSTNGQTDVETENDPLNYSMQETNKIRQQLGMKPLARDKFPSVSSPSPRESRPGARKSHTLEAVLLLLKDLDAEELSLVRTVTQNRLSAHTLSGDTLSHTLLTGRTTDMEH